MLNKINDPNTNDKWAIWNIIEILGFNNFLSLYEYFYDTTGISNRLLPYLHPIRYLRNAAAHNNCLLNNLKNPYKRVKGQADYKRANNIVKNIKSIGNTLRTNNLKNIIFCDITAMLYVFNIVEPSTRKEIFALRWKDFINRLSKNSSYFKNNNKIRTSFEFLQKLIDYYCDLWLNTK